MNYRLSIRNRATQDLRQVANYILVNGDSDTASRFLELVEVTLTQLATTPGMGKVVRWRNQPRSHSLAHHTATPIPERMFFF